MMEALDLNFQPSVSLPPIQFSSLDVEMSDLATASLSPAKSANHQTISEKGVLGAAPSSSPARDKSSLSPSVLHVSSSLSVDSPPPSRVSNLAAGVSEPGFNWAKNLTSTGKLPISSAPVSISAAGRPRVKVPNVVFERGAALHGDYIVGIFYGKAPSYGNIWGVLNFLWGKDKRVTVHNLTKNAFLFYIPSPSLRKRVLQQELWRVGDSPFFVMPWKSEFSFNPPSLAQAPVWASIKDIPFDLITPEGISIICRPLGRAVDYKPFNSINSADVKVVVDLTKPLPSVLELKRDDGHILLLTVTFPWLPPLCSFCKEIGHKSALCPNTPSTDKETTKTRFENHPSRNPVTKQQETTMAEPKKVWIQAHGKNVDSTAPVNSDIPVSLPVSQSPHHISSDVLAPSVSDAPVDCQIVNHVTGKLPPSKDALVSMNNTSETSHSSQSNFETPFDLASRTGVPSDLSLVTNPSPTTSNPFHMLQDVERTIVLVEDSRSLGSSGKRSSSSTSPKQKKLKRKLDVQQSPPQGGVLSLLGEKCHSH